MTTSSEFPTVLKATWQQFDELYRAKCENKSASSMLSIIEKIAPLVQFPLVRFPLGDELKAMLKRLCDRSEVVKDLFDEAVQMQLDKGTNGQVSTRNLKKHRLLNSEEEQEVPRLKKRKMCENDEVPALTIGQIGAALMA